MISPQITRDTEILLKDCKNVQEMFIVLSKKFDLESCQPGAIAKPQFISGIIKGIQMLNPKLKS